MFTNMKTRTSFSASRMVNHFCREMFLRGNLPRRGFLPRAARRRAAVANSIVRAFLRTL
jgi:hypothetical protein